MFNYLVDLKLSLLNGLIGVQEMENVQNYPKTQTVILTYYLNLNNNVKENNFAISMLLPNSLPVTQIHVLNLIYLNQN
jgi:hypothetical protein